TKGINKYFHNENPEPAIKNDNVTLILILTQIGPDVHITGKVLDRDNTNPLAMRRLRDLYVRRERWEEAHQIQGRIVKEKREPEEYTRFMHIRYEMGKALYQRGEREKGKRLVKAATKMDKSFAPASITLGDFYLRENRTDDAAALWERGFEQTGNIILLHRLEDLYLQQGMPEKILWIYKQALYKKPEDLALRFYLGKLYYRLEMLDEAYATLSDLEIQDVPMPHLHKILGNIYERKEDWIRAVSEFKKALKLRKRVIIPYYCPECDYHTHEWSGRCPRCGRWNTFSASPTFLKLESVPPFKKRNTLPSVELSYMEGLEGSGADYR
ncbi:MAG: tetratricopeptide repeat protein, partial [Nitrospirae bacterium]|nr:tetratricopeptide repeat protein [Nitrospirota bacterium]